MGGDRENMIQLRSQVKVADNTGAKVVSIIQVLGGSGRRYARIGNVVTAVVKKAEPRREVKKSDIVRAVVVRTRAPLRRADGSYVRFDENAVVLVEKQDEPRGSRIFGPIPRELKSLGYEKIANLAEVLV